METLILIVSSVLITLGIILVIWLISSVRSAQKQLKDYDGDIPDIHRRIDQESHNIYQHLDNMKMGIDKEFENSYQDLDKRFDNSYRTMYELRDSLQSDVDRLIEKDLETSKSKTK